MDVVLKSAKESIKKKLEILETFKRSDPKCDEAAELAKLGMTVEEAETYRQEFQQQKDRRAKKQNDALREK